MSFIKWVKKMRHKVLIKWYSFMPIKKNKIIVWANSFKQYGCSPKYITEYLLKYYPGKYDIVWVFDYKAKIPSDLHNKVRIVYYFSIPYLKELHTAKFIICNMRMGEAHYWHKRKGQIYIQTWHSSIRLKKIEKDAEQSLGLEYIKQAKKDSERIDILISGCDFSTKIFKKSFWYNGAIMKSGTPRCDILFGDTSAVRNKVFKNYNIDADYKIVLYAPTFRTGKTADLHNIKAKKIVEALGEKFGGKWVFAYRLHPNILSDYIFNMEEAIDATNYSDMQELIAASDILITDYSSCMFDMLIAGKKCILYTPDIDKYIKNERGLYFNFEELPFPLARSNEELRKKIIEFNDIDYEKKKNEFLSRIGSYESGSASKMVAKFIEEKCNE